MLNLNAAYSAAADDDDGDGDDYDDDYIPSNNEVKIALAV